MNLKSKRIIGIIFVLILACFFVYGQSYEEEYPVEYKKALALRFVYKQMMENEEIENPDFYLSIVFPEMIRYSEIRDSLETLLNKLSYTTIEDYEGCSIGAFQMKPSFAETIEYIILQDPVLQKKYPSLVFESNKSFSSRYSRILRLQEKTFQISYLLAFVDICFKKFSLEQFSESEKLKILATAYNAGFSLNYEQLLKYTKLKGFPEGFNSEKSLWNYSDLVIYYYQIFTKK